MVTIELPEGHVTKFEKARLIGARSLQISMGAPFLIKISEDELKKMNYNPIEIAKLEFEQDALNIDVKRISPHQRK
ncbi:MAG: DNA-directed RNA polymerase subunit K [Candidatus Woesearchaeota archaeon]|jgi:DNA-directed RNA polymerase subunit K/omega